MKVFTFEPPKRMKNPIIEVTCACGCKTKFSKKLMLHQTALTNHFVDKEHMAVYRHKKTSEYFNK